ncbi:histidine phosphatase family protein [uncultured Microbacterium sp.]|uniref:histidine phosphatase family protein n=1 Tax=uncultured Microbacterium sp. TaxID=191216 RepID=UPI0025DE20E0|nr:histidine phosphatase family protein [uncultured Microbacterium sp.]
MTLLTLVRHGETDWNRQGRLQGSTDIPLNETGREQARAAAASLHGASFDVVYTSPLGRARETAEIIAHAHGLASPLIATGMRERGYGDGEGMSWEEYARRYRAAGHDAPNAETAEQLLARSLASLRRIDLAARRRSAPRPESVLVATHGGVIRALLEHASAGTLPDPGQRIGNASLHRFVMDGGGLRLIDAATV